MEQKLETIPYELKPTVIIQARMGSSRLPGKVLIDIAGQPMLVHVVERARQSILVKEVVVATTDDPSDEPIARLCKQYNYLCFRGSPLDVLDRYFQAALTYQATNIVRLTGDCPLIDPTLIDHTVQAFLNLHPVQPSSDWKFRKYSSASSADSLDFPSDDEMKSSYFDEKEFDFAAKRFDFACTRLPPPWQRTFPIGQDIEVCTFSSLKRAWEESSMPYHREHVMPYLYEESRSIHFGIDLGKKPAQVPDGSTLSNLPKWLTSSAPSDPNPFFVLRIDHHPDYGNLRWTVDTPEDLEYVQKILSHFCTKEKGFLNSEDPLGTEVLFGTFRYTWYDVLELIQENPGLDQTNHQSKAKDYREVDPRLNQC